MSNLPDLSNHGYQVIRELGRNREGGRITWLASDLKTGQQVVLKQFCFAQAGSSWSAFNAYQREIQVLQGLNHPGIPRYLGALQTQDGFCLIQEYKNAASLAVQRSFEPDEIKEIAVKALEIIVDLQNRIPPVIHRDIKPENILVDEQLNVYLIDFGFARIGGAEVSGSSVFKGTPGFIPPEQLRKPTEASDLYGLGATLICLLTGTKSTAIQDLTDDDDPYLIHFKPLVPRLSLRFINWLEKMVQPRAINRFANAEAALEALKPLYIIRVPEVTFSQPSLEFAATRLGERLTQTITLTNSIPETLLEGRWEVAPHPSDPPHTPNSHAWISFAPAEFASNQADCRITVDTSKLMADKVYYRQIFLHTNSLTETYSLTVKVQNAPIPIEDRKFPYGSVAIMFLLFLFSWHAFFFLAKAKAVKVLWFMIAVMLGLGSGTAVENWSRMTESKSKARIWAWLAVGLLLGIPLLISKSLMAFIAGSMVRIVMDSFAKRGFSTSLALAVTILTAALGISLGNGFKLGFLHPLVVFAVSLTALPLATMFLYPPINRRLLIAKYRQSEQHLIKH